jgi:DHA3 family tetracycline resistance protein-like MFS transporter
MRSLLARVLRLRLVEPLAERDFALLTAGAFISLLGDGFFFVALAWQVYEISNVPTALSLVGLAWTLPLVLFVLIGGVFTDRYDRRWLLIGADVIRAVAIGVIGVLSVTGALELWHVIGLIAFVGLGNAFFNPAATAIVPDLLPERLLPQANALQGMVRPLTVRLIGPALGGLTVAAAGPGTAFLIDAASFLVSAASVAAIRPRARREVLGHGLQHTLAEMGQGLSFVRATPWLWATLISAMLSLLVFAGPHEVLLPFLVKNRLDLGPDALGAIFAVGGVGAVLMAISVGQLGLPRRRVTVMYGAWSIGVFLIAGFGLMTELWHALLLSAVGAALFELGSIIWVTMLQQLVPRELLGRVSSLDWLVSIGLVPVSFALTGPVAGAIGAETTLVVGGVVGAILMGGLLFAPGVRDPERQPAPSSAVGSPEATRIDSLPGH